jgi:hypothetical protein
VENNRKSKVFKVFLEKESRKLVHVITVDDEGDIPRKKITVENSSTA